MRMQRRRSRARLLSQRRSLELARRTGEATPDGIKAKGLPSANWVSLSIHPIKIRRISMKNNSTEKRFKSRNLLLPRKNAYYVGVAFAHVKEKYNFSEFTPEVFEQICEGENIHFHTVDFLEDARGCYASYKGML